MPETKPQSYANHAKVDPLYHYFISPVALGNVLVQAYLAVRQPDYGHIWSGLLAVAFAAAVYRIRTYPLKVQDRLIRLEERLRMERVLPAAAYQEIAKLREGQFVALRFASDAELPGLTEQTLTNNWKGEEIKTAIRNWRADHFRV